MASLRNVILISIDSLAYHRLQSSAPGRRTLTPTLDYLAKNGISCTHAFTHGLPTQLAFPAIFTSTLPLDHGGYDRGIRNRKVSLAESLRRQGFHTVGFATDPNLGRYFSYERGFTEFYELFSIKLFWRLISKVYLTYHRVAFENGVIDREERDRLTKSLVEESYQYILEFCRRQEEGHVTRARYNPAIHGYDFEWLRTELSRHLRDLDAENGGLEPVEIQERTDQLLEAARSAADRRGIVASWADRTLERVADQVQRRVPLNILTKYSGHVSGAYLRETLCSWIDANQHEPFFLWTHFNDVHDGRCASGAIQMPALLRRPIIDRRRLRKSYYKDVSRTMAVRYVDQQIGLLVEFLRDRNLLHKTLLVICGDHGAAVDRPTRRAHKARLLYEEFIRVPLTFYNPELKAQTVDSLCGLIDLGPTILDLLGVERVPEFKGRPVYSQEVAKRTYVQLENVGRGPCDLERKEPNICLRTKRYKYIGRGQSVFKSAEDLGEKDELYDLEADPEELRNVIEEGALATTRRAFERVAKERREDIRGQAQQLADPTAPLVST